MKHNLHVMPGCCCCLDYDMGCIGCMLLDGPENFGDVRRTDLSTKQIRGYLLKHYILGSKKQRDNVRQLQ